MKDYDSEAAQFNLLGHAAKNSRAYQQGGGHQFNVEHAYFSVSDDQYNLDVRPGEWPIVGDLDALEVGVHRAAVKSGSPVTPYVARDVDEELRGQLEAAASSGGFILVVGDSTAGKTRSAYEAMVSVIPTHRLAAPEDSQELRSYALAAMDLSEPCVIWLDNLERFLGPNGLTMTIVAQLRRTRVPVVATMRAQLFNRMLQSIGSDQSDSAESGRVHTSAQLVERASVVILDRLWSRREVERARACEDSRIIDAVRHHTSYGVAEYLAAGPRLLVEWRAAKAIGANPRGAALISAAIDLSRVGIFHAIPLSLLQQVHEYYLQELGGVRLQPESFDDALAWALKRRHGVTSMLLQETTGHSGYRVFDYLLDVALRDSNLSEIPEFIWGIAISFAEDDQNTLFAIGIAAFIHENLAVAEESWLKSAEVGNFNAAANLGLIYLSTKNFSAAEQYLLQAVLNGNKRFALELGMTCFRMERLEEAEKWLLVSIEAHSQEVAHELASSAKEIGFEEEPSYWHQQVSLRRAETASVLADVLIQRERRNEAESWLREALSGGDERALVNLGVLLDENGEVDEAESLWREAASRGIGEGAANIGILCSNRGELNNAEEWLTKAIDLGFEKAAFDLGVVCSKMGKSDRAEELWRKAGENGIVEAKFNLGILLFERGDDRGKEYIQEAAESGSANAAYFMGNEALDDHDLVQGRKWLEIAVGADIANAACRLGRYLFDRAANDEMLAEAESYLKRAVELGHTHSACVLGQLYEQQGREGDAKERFIQAYKGGHKHAVLMLEHFHRRHGAGAEAAYWRSLQLGGRRRKSGKKRRKRSLPKRRR